MADYDLWIVTQGMGTVQINDRLWEIRSPQAFIFIPGEHVVGRHDARNPLEVWSLHFYSVSRHGLGIIAKLCRGMTIHRLSGLLALLETYMEQQEYRDPLADKQMAHLTGLILTILWRQAHQLPPLPSELKLEALIRAIRKSPQQDWPMTRMCSMTGLATTRLSARLRQMTGVSPVQFVIRTRLTHAAGLLRETSLSISEIADACGYRDVYFFTRQFTAHQGISPSRFRNGNHMRS